MNCSKSGSTAMGRVPASCNSRSVWAEINRSSNAMPVNNFYRQNVYDPNDNKIGDVADLLVEKDGRVTAAILSVGGFLGMGEKDVAVPFDALRLTQKNQKWYLVMNTDKDTLKNAPGFKRDRTQDRWVPENQSK